MDSLCSQSHNAKSCTQMRSVQCCRLRKQEKERLKDAAGENLDKEEKKKKKKCVSHLNVPVSHRAALPDSTDKAPDLHVQAC